MAAAEALRRISMSLIKRTTNPFRDAGLPEPELLAVKQEAIEFLRAKLHETGMSQAELARQADLEPPHVSDMMAGRLNRFGVERINRALAVFGAETKTEYRLSSAA
jgi:predicted XRE-type DNA-binding protein